MGDLPFYRSQLGGGTFHQRGRVGPGKERVGATPHPYGCLDIAITSASVTFL